MINIIILTFISSVLFFQYIKFEQSKSIFQEARAGQNELIIIRVVGDEASELEIYEKEQLRKFYQIISEVNRSYWGKPPSSHKIINRYEIESRGVLFRCHERSGKDQAFCFFGKLDKKQKSFVNYGKIESELLMEWVIYALKE